MTINDTWTDPSEAGSIDLDTGQTLTETVYDKIISNLNFLGGTDGSLGRAKAYVVIEIKDKDGTWSVENDVYRFTIPANVGGMNLVDADAAVYTASSSGTPTVMVHNLTDTSDMLSTAITIDANETDSTTAATPPVINAAEDDVVEGDVIRVDIDAAGTGTKGLSLRLGFQKPAA